MAQFFVYALTSLNINRFSKLFHCQNQEKICSNTIIKDPTTRKVIVTSCRSSAGILRGCLRQNGVPSHTARNTPTYLRREKVTFIEPHMWPPNSPDLNPVDCAVWGALQQMVYQRRRFTTINQLKQAIATEWGNLSLSIFFKCVVTGVVLFSTVAFKTLDISQGSVATHLRCDGIFSHSIITNFLLILTVK